MHDDKDNILFNTGRYANIGNGCLSVGTENHNDDSASQVTAPPTPRSTDSEEAYQEGIRAQKMENFMTERVDRKHPPLAKTDHGNNDALIENPFESQERYNHTEKTMKAYDLKRGMDENNTEARHSILPRKFSTNSFVKSPG